MSEPNPNPDPNDGPKTHDFAATVQSPGSTQTAPAVLPTSESKKSVHYDLTLDTSVPGSTLGLPPPSRGSYGGGNGNNSNIYGISRSDTEMSRLGIPPPTPLRIRGRSATFRTVEDFEDFEHRPGWHPGAEPGIDPSKPDGGHASMPQLAQRCEVLVADFSQHRMETHQLNNDTLEGFLNQKQPPWVKCRWINVNGLSWDVISALGKHKGLHKLAIEDLMNTRNRTKADWYATHAFIILTLQKLVHLEDEDSDSECGDDGGSVRSARSTGSRKAKKLYRRAKRFFTGQTRHHLTASNLEKGPAAISAGVVPNGDAPFPARPARVSSHDSTNNPYLRSQPTGFSDVPTLNTLRTLQRYHASPNDARTAFMEDHSPLAARNLAVIAEQVSLFITADNTVISFFEQSAQDVERPILARLSAADTVLRSACDASMVAQAIIDAIIDLAIPVAACYSDVVADLELDVLTSPDVSHTKKLYIAITEMNKMLGFVNPITGLIGSLRDHHEKEARQQKEARQMREWQLRFEASAGNMSAGAGGVPPGFPGMSRRESEATLGSAGGSSTVPTGAGIISPMTHMYLGDVLDHCVLISEMLGQVKEQADGMISLIFNTISAYQNRSVKLLTFITIVFLPLTFITGYFGQNFDPFPEIYYGIEYFWKIAPATLIGTISILMSSTVWGYIKTLTQRRRVFSMRKMRRKRLKSQESTGPVGH